MDNYLESNLSYSILGKNIIQFNTNDNIDSNNNSLCAKITNVLDEIYNDSTTNNAQITNTELISNKLSVNEISILECGLVVADISNLSKDIENEYTNVVQKNEEDILEAISIIDRFNEVVVPSLENDLDSVQRLLTSLEERQVNHMKEQQYKWIKMFNYFSSSSVANANDIKLRKEENIKYNYQISSCTLHDSNTLINQLTNDNNNSSNGSSCCNSTNNSYNSRNNSNTEQQQTVTSQQVTYNNKVVVEDRNINHTSSI